MHSAGFRARVIVCLLGLLVLAAARPSSAGTLSVMWDPSPDANAVGYVVYIRVPGGQTTSIDAGNTTSYAWNGAVDGQQYYVSVAAYAQGGVLGQPSPEVPRYTNLPPALTNPGLQFATKGTGVSLQLSGSDPEGSRLTYGATGLPPGLSVNGSGRISGVPTTTGSFLVVATASDGSLTDAETFTWTIVAPPQDSAPAISVAMPNSGAPANPNSGTSPTSDNAVNTPPPAPAPAPEPMQPNAGPTVSAPQPSPSAPAPAPPAAAPQPGPAPQPLVRSMARSVFGKKSASPAPAPAETTNQAATTANARGWRAVSAAAKAAKTTSPKSANQTASSTTAASTPVTVQGARTTPWSRAKIPTTTTDKPVITLAGSAADDRVVGSVDWVTDRGLTGSASGTETWIAAVPLLPGLNKITINVRDNAGNVTSTTVAVDYVDGQTRKK